MLRERFAHLIAHAGAIAPEGIENHIADLEPQNEARLFDHSLLEKYLAEYAVSQELSDALWQALSVIESDRELLELSSVLRQDAVRAHSRCTANEFFAPVPDCLAGFAQQAYAFLYALGCVEEGRRNLRRRGVPEHYDADIPERMIRRQLRKYIKTGDISFDDYGWDIGFYCCAIFLLDRFYFIPYRHDAPEAWRNIETGRVIALWPGNVRVRRDGQLDGVNGIFDPDAITTVYIESETAITAHPVDPAGLIRPAPVTLDKAKWQKELCAGDHLIGLHIPGGEGYTPERVRSSCEMAVEFFDRYYPEYSFKGIWSESWLFDPGLAALLPPESRILQVAKQFYCYPTMEGEEMTKYEVFGTDDFDPAAVECRTSLQRNLCRAWLSGAHFHDTGMFLLRREIPQVGSAPYRH